MLQSKFFFLVFLGFVSRGKLDEDIPACPEPLPPNNGYVQVYNRTAGSIAKVGCSPGYFRTGSPHTITCTNDGVWSDFKIKCRPRSCGDPGAPRNGRRLGLLFRYKDTVQFTCNHGYVLRGPSTRRCQSNQTWSLTQPHCAPISCGQPPKVQNSVPVVYGRSRDFVYGNKVFYECHPGFRRQDGDFLSCESDGRWQGSVPKCTEVNCPNLKDPVNGSLIITNSNYTKEGQRVRYKCHAGFMLFGPHVRTCSGSGRWTGPEPICFKCAEVGTHVFIRKPVYFRHAVVQSKAGHTVTVRYDEHEEEDIITIGQGTQHYIIVQDRVPNRDEIFIGSRILAFNPRLGKFMFATVLYFKDFEKERSYGVRYDGKWYKKAVVTIKHIRTLEPPRFCATCNDPGRPLHSSREDDLTEFIAGMEVVYTCDYTFKRKGPERRKCLSNGTWTGQKTTCEAHSCDDLDAFPPANGERHDNGFTIGSLLEFTCKEGFELIGQKSLQCLPSGKWSDLPPICKHVCENFQCPSGQKCIYDKVVRRRCVCSRDEDCSARFDPVCGSDGKSYNNPCVMSATACRTGKDIIVVGRGRCQPGGLCQILPFSNCRASFQRFLYNSTSKTCEPFIAGGCHPSGWNGFGSEGQCKQKCLIDVCQQPANPGPCDDAQSRWFFDQSSGECREFLYGGCYGNENNFASKKLCLQRCKSIRKGPKCQQCTNLEMREVCRNSSMAVIAKVTSRLPDDVDKGLQRYAIDIQYVLKNTTQTIPEGIVVVSVPYKHSLDAPSIVCACPKLPLKKRFILIGRATSALDQSKSGFILDKTSYVAGWSLDVRSEVKHKCAGHVIIPSNIR